MQNDSAYAISVRNILDNIHPVKGERFHLDLIFSTPKNNYDWLVAAAVGQPVHVDMVLRRTMDGEADLSENLRMFYTAYVGEKFSVNLEGSEIVPMDKDRPTVSLGLHREEYHRMQQYLCALVGRVEYNYNDLLSLNPMVPKSVLGWESYPEVEGFEDPKNISKVFCSQAAVLAIKACMGNCGKDGSDGDIDGIGALYRNVSSRVVSPKRLFQDLSAALSKRVHR